MTQPEDFDLGIPDPGTDEFGEPNDMPPMCGRCYDTGPLFPANCAEKPERLVNVPLGMYHCPDCGAMIVAGMPHFDLCQLCIDRKHPGFDAP